MIPRTRKNLKKRSPPGCVESIIDCTKQATKEGRQIDSRLLIIAEEDPDIAKAYFFTRKLENWGSKISHGYEVVLHSSQELVVASRKHSCA